ncbi:MAG: hypothetical protein JAY75_21275 [Candidatus Thiodiazotropha taylori]|nr:hypothetical protein [Candidatus Thiodiazotropha taylori]MCG8096965.1 hypothetical protein [Candidatus Thiodiazotropha endolucinida]MCG8047213.1 hypothetical protein [Candidatus Thiodiazotropha taylori]MCG8078755.1 hypothetical protein [Candidatus Thiodiazotropha taylori]MCW4310751.1 hypothetical protein [Candidatus Thiodiazotropha endolucinida]
MSELRKKKIRAYAGDPILNEGVILDKMLEVRISYRSKIRATQDKISNATRKLSDLKTAKAKKDRAKLNFQSLH